MVSLGILNYRAFSTTPSPLMFDEICPSVPERDSVWVFSKMLNGVPHQVDLIQIRARYALERVAS
jgi:hypothetical protein